MMKNKLLPYVKWYGIVLRVKSFLENERQREGEGLSFRKNERKRRGKTFKYILSVESFGQV